MGVKDVRCGLDSWSSEHNLLVESCEHSTESLGSIKCG